MKEKGYEAGEEEAEKIEDIIEKHQKEENATDYEEDVQHAERLKEPRPLGTGEPIYLYIQTGVGTYTVVDTVFNSRIEARQFAESNFPNQKYKVMTEKDIEDYMNKLQQKQEVVDKTIAKAREVGGEVKEGGRRVAGGFLRASRDVAASHGMTRETMEPRIQRAWGVQGPVKEPLPPEPSKVQPKPPEPAPPAPEQPRRGFGIQPPQRKPMGFGQPQRPRGGINIPQQKRMRINIPPGGGVFGRPRPMNPQANPQQQSRNVRIPPGGGVFNPGRGMGGMPSARPHVITPGGVKPMGYREPPKEQPKKKKSKRRRR